jgi:hypothetical protein
MFPQKLFSKIVSSLASSQCLKMLKIILMIETIVETYQTAFVAVPYFKTGIMLISDTVIVKL